MTWNLRATLTTATILLLVTLAGPAAALGASDLDPEDGAVVSSTPRTVTVPVPVDADAVEVSLVSAVGSRDIPMTGEMTPRAGGLAVQPPALESGTYVLQWEYRTDTGQLVRDRSSFSVGEPNAAVGAASTAGITAAQLPALLLALTAAVSAAAAAGVAGRPARGWVAAAAAAAAAAATGAVTVVGSATTHPVLLLTGAGLLVAAAALSCWQRRSSLWVAAGAAAAATTLLSPAAVDLTAVGWAGPLTVAGLAGTLLLFALAMTSRRAAGQQVPDQHDAQHDAQHDDQLGAHAAARADGQPPTSDVTVTLSRSARRWLLFAAAVVLLPAGWAVQLLRVGGFGGLGSPAGWTLTTQTLATVLLALPLLALALVKLPRPAAKRTATAAAASLAGAVAVGALGAVSVPPAQTVALDRTIEAAETCLQGSNRLQTQRCLAQLYTSMVQQEGVEPALDHLLALTQQSGEAVFHCHEASHAIGRASMRSHDDIVAAFTDGYDVCDFGYYHGIVEAAADHLDDEEFRDAVPTLCAGLASENTLFYMQCLHGTGHAAALRANNDLNRGLEFCDELRETDTLADEQREGALNGCGTGVTMEWFSTASIAGSDSGAVSPPVSQPREVCAEVDERWQPECYEYVGNTLDTSRPAASLRELADWCLQTTEISACFVGLTRAAGGVGIDPQIVFDVCAMADNPALENCLTFYIVYRATTIDYRLSVVDELCEQLPADGTYDKESVCEQARTQSAATLGSTDGPDDVPDFSSDAPNLRG